MEVAVDDLSANLRRPIEFWQKRLAPSAPVSPVRLLPGPVPIAKSVERAFAEPPIYHREVEFHELFRQVRSQLSQMVAAAHTAIFVGGGTLANDIVAATLAAMPGAQSGLVLVNGEFGQRLVRHAHRSGLSPRVLSWPWGQAWQLDEVARAMDRLPPSGWVWGVHQETSTGVLNDLPGLMRLARARGLRVCVDCISSVGAVPLDLSQAHLATGSSGKALGSYAGLAFVFADPAKLATANVDRIPSSLDLRSALVNAGPLSTIPSPLVKALAAALAPYSTPELAQQRYGHYADLGALVRQRLSAAGLEPLAPESCASPVITTFEPPNGATSAEFVARCSGWGFEIAGHSDYLTQRNLVQIATMGNVSRKDCLRFFDHLACDQPIAGTAS
jgi:aspartate aminotransferase-like enzyme